LTRGELGTGISKIRDQEANAAFERENLEMRDGFL
jgi:hypothetical protein